MMTYLWHSSPFCNVCDSENLTLFMDIAKTGVSHGLPGHKYTYDSTILLVCQQCQHGQLVKYSHDCWAYFGDENWDMYWYYDLQPSDMKQLEILLRECPNPLDADCSCAVHTTMKTAWEFTSSYQANQKISTRSVPFTRVSLEIQRDSSILTVQVIRLDD
jgi:hypothetical protein